MAGHSHHAHGLTAGGAAPGRAVRRVVIIEFALNVAIAAIKITIGFLARNLTVISDGFHGVIDASNNVVGLIGLSLSHRPPDADHPYGHRKIEALMALGVGVVMGLTSWEILRAVFRRVMGEAEALPAPFDPFFFGAIVLTLLANVGISTYEMRMGRKYRSTFLIADAKHTRTHVGMDVMAMTSLILAGGMPWLDSVLALVVVGFLMRSGWEIVRDNAMIMIDSVRLDPGQVREVVESVEGIQNCHAIRSHGMPDEIHLDLHIVIAPDLTAEEAQRIESSVRDALFERFPYAAEVAIHHQTQPPDSESPAPVRRTDSP